ncbi:hypothetical protein [Leptolyngbya sp. FACHB-261]|uniref:hypothetical protein n=1 Tax=Leptolyngbya sp. FACHB-261 TaxID=2692806 RepID=UPI0016889378|nr:hypothetical protein [Leptolyngbya sp. FACHB-261]MBD2101731.1 hypothetical protein [Leptolyngbya sp. FACHB-261]
MEKPLQLTFANGRTASAIQVDDSVDLTAALRRMGLQGPRPVLVVVGGASQMTEESLARLQQLFVEVLAPLAKDLDAFVVNGGTDAGVMRMMGQARAKTGAQFPLIGVAPIGTIALPHQPASANQAERLEPNNTHFVLVPGNEWGDESPWQARVASTLAKDAPSVTVLINGGAIALVDVQENVKEGRPVVVIAGSGRLADEIADASLHPEEAARQPVAAVIGSAHLTLFNLSEPIAELGTILRQHLTREKPA